MPASRSRAAPPAASAFGSNAPMMTRSTPALISASAQGGVLPWCAHGSSDTYTVAPAARGPAASSAATSACRSPNRACQPSPTMSSPRTTTAPTMGFGAVWPQPRLARSIARRMNARSRAAPGFSVRRSERKAGADRPVPARLVDVVVERVEGVHRAAGHSAQLADQLDERDQIERDVAEDAGARRAHRKRHRRLRLAVHVVRDLRVGVVVVAAEAGGERHPQQVLA